MNLTILFFATAIIFGFMLLPDNAYSDSHEYCYDEDQEGYVCFDTLKMCEKEQKNDWAVESKCYKMK